MKRRVFVLWLLFVGVLGAPCAMAQGNSGNDIRVMRASEAFQGWLDARQASGALAIYRQGEEIATVAMGLDPDAPAEMASVGKAVTAICAMQLEDEGLLGWPDTLADALGTGPDLSMSVLLTHTSGIRADSTQDMMVRNVGTKGPGLSQDVFAAVTARGGAATGPGQFWYSNENYALAGLLIEAAGDGSYEEICRARALAPAGVDGAPSILSGRFLPWGGWAISATDFARFHSYWFGGDRLPGADPEALPFVGLGGGPAYGLGSFFRVLDRGNTFWHFGALCLPRRFEAGSYAVTWFGDWTVVAIYDTCVDDDDMVALDRALVDAMLGKIE